MASERTTEPDDRLTARDARMILHRLRWTQARAAEELGTDPRTMRRWLEANASLPVAESRLLRLLSG